MTGLRRSIAVVAVVIAFAAVPAHAQNRNPTFSSSRALLLKTSELPSGIHYHGSKVIDSVLVWDQNIKPIVQIDVHNGWLEGAEEFAQDSSKRDVGLSVQLFRSNRGALSDFGQFFTNAHPETIYLPGQHWLGGSAVKGFGNRATLYRIQDDTSLCPGSIVSGLTFVYGNGIFSVNACLRTIGDGGVMNLGRRLLTHAIKVH